MKGGEVVVFGEGWLVALARAQDHFQVGAYGDYFRITQTNTDLAGLGGRAAVKILPHVMLEGEMSYDFEQAFTERCLSSGCTVTVANSNLKVLHGLAGPKIIGGHGKSPPFLFRESGFLKFPIAANPPAL